jgi:MATE family multidrug resistance protein
MGATGGVADAANTYMLIRWWGAPAMLVMLGVFGSLRGVQDMRTPLWIALGINALNIVLDPILIFGWGPVPASGIAGAAAASTASQWIGAGCAVWMVRSRIGAAGPVESGDLGRLLRIGGDLFIRTGMLTLFLVLGTRAATRLGPDAGAAHQAVRQVWVFTALFLDAWALSAQSLVGYFVGAARLDLARRVAALTSAWSAITGCALGLVLWSGTSWIILLLVPPPAESVFYGAWWLALASLPLGALTFATDGIHWGTGDFGFLRNATLIATTVAGGLLIAAESTGNLTLSGVWWLTVLWVTIRATLGMVRIWPGIGAAPLASDRLDCLSP